MGFLDDIKRVMSASDEEDDDFFEGASESYRPAPRRNAQESEFERAFSDTRPAAAPAPEASQEDTEERPSLFGNLGKKQSAPKKQVFRGTARGVPGEQIVFTPHTVDDAANLIVYLKERRTVIMSLDESDANYSRRLLDFCLGITMALDGRLTQISGSTFLITPDEVDVITAGGQPLRNETL